ncbi:MAG TPA: BrxA/BrxB family bacilliredoxin [candidate division Zixibacteria bacterium]|nr:BrxA/BrxB family bacilliredoxin [candidate division Zixibacteria bacterium]
MYPPDLVAPMRTELTELGFDELTTAEEVVSCFSGADKPFLLVVNSVCGCSAGGCRPAVKLALLNDKRPAKLVTVFAGQDAAATAKAREFIVGYPPSSPMIVLFVDGKPAFVVERHQIEGRMAQEIAADLVDAFNRLL